MGGKTIGSIERYNPIPSYELKLLSRCIDPKEPLASPHASPRKPPLPKMNCQYACEPCHKRYKTRNGLRYHLQRCKYKPTACIYSRQIKEATLVECNQCKARFHTQCVQPKQHTRFLCTQHEPAKEPLELFFSDKSFHAFMSEQSSDLWESDLISASLDPSSLLPSDWL